jgi:hypothetical protein
VFCFPQCQCNLAAALAVCSSSGVLLLLLLRLLPSILLYPTLNLA